MAQFGVVGSKEGSTLIEGCTTLSYMPGKIITESLGVIQYTLRGVASDAPETINSIFESLLQAALEKGANAVVNVRIVTGSYQQLGTDWQVAYLVAYGDAVAVE